MGTWEYAPLLERYHVPMVVTGFEPLDLVRGILMLVRQLEQGRAEVENAYERVVVPQGNPGAMKIIDEVFQECDRFQ
jgi:hydrogenase expression/formation protein HypD